MVSAFSEDQIGVNILSVFSVYVKAAKKREKSGNPKLPCNSMEDVRPVCSKTSPDLPAVWPQPSSQCITAPHHSFSTNS